MRIFVLLMFFNYVCCFDYEACGIANEVPFGKEVTPHKYPWQAFVMDDFTGEFCGGTLISNQHILTASHCVFGKTLDQVMVVVGAHSVDKSLANFLTLSKIETFPGYNISDSLYSTSDIAILTLERKLMFNSTIRPICLPVDASKLYVGEEATVVGWGLEDANNQGPISDTLKEVNVTVISNMICKQKWNFIKDMHLCSTFETGSHCKGDSGGPIFLKENGSYTIIGVASFGHAESCDSYYPGFARITPAVKSWILSHALGSKDSSLLTCSKESTTPSICPTGWIDTGVIGMGCLWFSDFELNWFNADRNCRSKQSHLFEVKSRTQFQYLKEMWAKNNNQTNPNQNKLQYLWAGATDEEGDWIWTNSGDTVGEFLWKTWSNGQREPVVFDVERCMVMDRWIETLEDISMLASGCKMNYSFVCQIN